MQRSGVPEMQEHFSVAKTAKVLPRFVTAQRGEVLAMTMVLGLSKCSGLIEPDTLIRDNIYQLLRCENGTETNIQTIY